MHSTLPILYNWGLCLYQQALVPSLSFDVRRALLEHSCTRFEQAMAFDPANNEVLTNWGNSLCSLAENATDETSEQLFLAALSKYEQSSESIPDDLDNLVNWASALYNFAEKECELNKPEAASSLYENAIIRFREILVKDPSNSDAYTEMANCLAGLGAIHPDNSVSLFDEAIAVLEGLASKQPRDMELLSNVAAVCESYAEWMLKKEVNPATIEQMLLKSFSIRAGVLTRDPESSSDNYLTTSLDDVVSQADTSLALARLRLKQLARTVSDPTVVAALSDAYRFYTAAKRLSSENLEYDYNLACVCALAGREEEAKTFLLRIASVDMQQLQDAKHDSDFDSIRGADWFIELIR
eukprot:GILJ01009643.1.p1 GENE.GILJ01009643.1~~GILJ01009643.1.p1  ORF type:complete len:354 (-),score=60.12 GILJ01009643.1:53-1114(-)